ncbi:restriction endonuclease [Rhodovulum sp. DZ06]|uniref:restriction endonuclease n=1 Tax=Rhodovulum sp. DZ06 TaxID=3425126 RepID=UPI003D355A64
MTLGPFGTDVLHPRGSRRPACASFHDLQTSFFLGIGLECRRSGDGGIDGVVNEDALGLDAVYVQAKRYAPENKVGRPALQAFVGAMSGESATKGVFVTTSGFTREAEEYLRTVSKRIVLVDGARLARLMIAHGIGVREQERFVVLGIDEAAFDDL